MESNRYSKIFDVITVMNTSSTVPNPILVARPKMHVSVGLDWEHLGSSDCGPYYCLKEQSALEYSILKKIQRMTVYERIMYVYIAQIHSFL
jgi:hypothetical protein